jgi:ribosomal protein S18 acetylase RimI-like enzyme
MSYITVALNDRHDRAAFRCGKEMLDTYLQRQAGQDMRRKLATCFVLSDDGKKIKGYYTLSANAIPGQGIPANVTKKLTLPTKGDMPLILLGRLAVDLTCKGHGLGAALLVEALQRSFDTASHAVAAIAVVVDPLDEEASGFYRKFGFITLPDSRRMFLPMKTIGQVFGAKP